MPAPITPQSSPSSYTTVNGWSVLNAGGAPSSSGGGGGGSSTPSLGGYSSSQNASLLSAFNALTPAQQQAYRSANPNLFGGGGGVASFGTPISPTVTPTINAGQVGQTKPLTVTPTTPLSDINTYVNGLVTEQNANPTQLEQDRTSLKGTLESLFNKQAGKSDRFSQLNERFNVPGMVNQLNDLNMQIAQRKNFFTQQTVTAEGKAIPTPFIVGEQTQIQRQAAVELGALASVAQALQGNIQLANDTIDRTLKMEFEPVENQINQVKTLLDLNYQDLTTQEKKRADLTKTLLDKQQAMVDELKVAKKEAYTAVINSAVDPSQKSQAALEISRAGNTDEAYAVMLKYGAPKADTQVVDIGGNKVLIDSRTGKTIKTLGASGTAPISLTGEGKPLVDAFNSAVAGVPGTQLPTMQKTFSNLVQQGDIEGAKSYIIRVAMSNASVDQQNQAIGRKNAVAALTDIKTLLADAEAKGVKTGLLSGSAQNVAEKLGREGNQDLAQIGNQIKQAIQTYRKAMSGVAFSPAESKEYKAIYPDITNVNGLNTTKIDSLLDTFDRNNKAVLGFYIGDANYEKLYGKGATVRLQSEKDSNPWASVLSPQSVNQTIYDASSGMFNIPTN